MIKIETKYLIWMVDEESDPLICRIGTTEKLNEELIKKLKEAYENMYE